jgi:hypothetical protein
MVGTGIRFTGSGAGMDFGRATQEQAASFVALMGVLHSEPTASAFARLLRKQLIADDYVQLAHVFEEISVLALHRHIAEELLFDAFAFDMYWDELREDVLAIRRLEGNEKLCENFEIAAERARRYRQDFPPKLRWQRRDHPSDGPQGPQGGRPGRRDRPPTRPGEPGAGHTPAEPPPGQAKR